MAYSITPLEQVERLGQLAEIIESHPNQFDMSWWVQGPQLSTPLSTIDWLPTLRNEELDMLSPACTTRGCVAGWTVVLWEGELPDHAPMSIESAADMLLGLDGETSSWLFDADAEHQSAGDAALVLRDLAAYVSENNTTEGFVVDGFRTDQTDIC